MGSTRTLAVADFSILPVGVRWVSLTGLYHPGGFGAGLSFTRAGTASYHDAVGVMQVAAVDQPRLDRERGSGLPRGLLMEGARSNLFLQSATPASQSITVTAQIYALSFYGTGSITLSGAHVATLNGSGADLRAVLLFTPVAVSLTLTVSGDVQLAQLEAGNCATSYIATTTAAVTRAADVCTLTLGSWWNAAEGTMLVEWQDINQPVAVSARIVGMAGSRTLMNLSGPLGTNNAVRLEMWNGSASVGPIAASDITKGAQCGAAAWSATGRSVAVRGVLATGATPLWDAGAPTVLYLGHSGSGLQINGSLRRVTYYAKRLSDAQLLALAP